MAMMDESDLLCLVCNSNIDLNSCTNIFYVCLPHNGEVLANFVLKVLKLSASDLKSSSICSRCYNLFGMLEQAQWTATNIKSEIFKVFQKNRYEKSPTNISENHIIETNEVAENFAESERLSEVNESKIIAEHLLENKVNLLSNTINPDTNKSIIINDSILKDIDESNVINSEKESKVINFPSSQQYLETDKVSNEPYTTDTVKLNSDNISIFYNEDFKVSELEEQTNYEQKDARDISNLQNDANIDESTNLIVSLENTVSDSNKKSWKSQRVSKYSQKPLKHACPTCNKMWRTSTELKIHMKSHSSVRPYMCEKCGQAYKHKHALEIHVGMHNGVNPFRCSHCDKCFTQKGALQRHLRMHTGETPYQCELCGKRFVHHTSYNMHALSHTGQKSFRCHLCNLSLMSTSHLKRHMRVHTGERPYSCNICDRSFAERYNLLAHQKVHDPLQTSARELKKKQYKCDQCKSSFSKKQQFETHLKQHSAEKVDSKWIDQTVDVAAQNETDYPANGADLLESCVNEVWQSLTLTNSTDERLNNRQR